MGRDGFVVSAEQLINAVRKRLIFINNNLEKEQYDEFWKGKFSVVSLIGKNREVPKRFNTETSINRIPSMNTFDE